MKQISDVRISDTDASFVLLCRKFRRIKLFHDDRRILLKFKLQNAFSTVYTPFEIHVEMINCLANEMICIYIITGGTREEINKQKVHFRWARCDNRVSRDAEKRPPPLSESELRLREHPFASPQEPGWTPTAAPDPTSPRTVVS